MNLSELVFEGTRPATPTLVEDVHSAWPCQVHGGEYVAGQGWRFDYCRGSQQFVASWALATRMRERRQLHVCLEHGLAFARRQGLAVGSDSQGGRGSRENGQGGGAEGPIAARNSATTTSDPFEDDDDAPYARVREAGQA